MQQELYKLMVSVEHLEDWLQSPGSSDQIFILIIMFDKPLK